MPMPKGHKHTEESKAKMSAHMRGKKRPPFTEEHRMRISLAEKGKIVSDETRRKISKAMQGKLIAEKNPMYGVRVCGDANPNWRGGASFSPYCPKFNETKKEEIRDAFGRCCAWCGRPESENVTKTGRKMKLSVHHVDEDKDQGCNGKKWSLIPLCMHCHNRTTR